MVPALGRARPQRCRVRREHAAVAGELRMKRKAQQAALLEILLERQHSWEQVEERLGRQSVVRAKHPYDAILLNDEFSSAAVGGLLQMQRGRQTFRNRLQRQILRRCRRGANQHGQHRRVNRRCLPPNKSAHACGNVHRCLMRLRSRGSAWCQERKRPRPWQGRYRPFNPVPLVPGIAFSCPARGAARSAAQRPGHGLSHPSVSLGTSLRSFRQRPHRCRGLPTRDTTGQFLARTFSTSA